MNVNQLLALIRQKIGFLILGGILLAALSFLFLVVNEKNFKASTDFLVVQDQTEAQDFYSLSKSAEYISKMLGESVYSELFIDEVVRTGKVNNEFLPFDKKKKLKEWSKIVKIKKTSQLGNIGIEVLGNSQEDTLKISEGIIEVMTKKNYLFRGKVGVDVRVLSGPVLEKNPSVEKIILAVIGGLILGVLIGFLRIYYQRDKYIAKQEGISEAEYRESLEDLDK